VRLSCLLPLPLCSSAAPLLPVPASAHPQLTAYTVDSFHSAASPAALLPPDVTSSPPFGCTINIAALIALIHSQLTRHSNPPPFLFLSFRCSATSSSSSFPSCSFSPSPLSLSSVSAMAVWTALPQSAVPTPSCAASPPSPVWAALPCPPPAVLTRPGASTSPAPPPAWMGCPCPAASTPAPAASSRRRAKDAS
jgi:hypothetical protein